MSEADIYAKLITSQYCGHTFHKECIDKWKHHNTCPYCRKELTQLEKYWKIKEWF